MSTQPYSPQRTGAPPARPGKFVPTLGLPEIVAITAIPGANAPTSIEGSAPEVVFVLTDERKWYVPFAVADQIYRLRIAPRQQIEVVKIGRMKHEVKITPLQAHLGSQNGPGAVATAPVPNYNNNYTTHQHNPAPEPPPIEWPQEQRQIAAPEQPQPSVNSKFLAGYMVAIDTLLEAKVYAQRKGLALEIKCDDVRALAATIVIDQQRGGR